jgi:hypothetical protein
MALSIAPEFPEAMVDEKNNFSVSFAGKLDSGEAIASVSSVDEEYSGTVGDLTITNKAVSTSTLVINDLSVAAGLAVQFHVTGQVVANSPYSILMEIVTDSTPAQTKGGRVRFSVVA